MKRVLDNRQPFMNRAISAFLIEVGKNIYMTKGFRAEGEVNLSGAKIGGELVCYQGEFINPCKLAINAESIEAKNVLFDMNFCVVGTVDLVGAQIDGLFVWREISSPNEVALYLASARIGTLLDEEKSWPKTGKLRLQNLIYNGINDTAPSDAKSRIRWLRLQPRDRYRPQPYEQLAEVLKKEGREYDAKEVLIAKNEERISIGKLTWGERLWYRLLGLVIGYGYRPFNAIKYIIGFIIFGYVTFKIGYKWGLIEPLKDRVYNYPKLNCFIYSLDMFIPLINLYQKDYWLPFSNKRHGAGRKISCKCCFGYVLRGYLWLHIIAGWILTTLFLGGITGLIRT